MSATGAAAAPGARARENPYVGLVPFGEDDRPWFFGRDVERRIIGANVRSSRLTLVYGASGVGKSSLLLAAVLPDLRAVVARDRAAREGDDPAAGASVRFAVAAFGSWRDAPLHGLMSAVASSVGEATGEAVEPWTPGTSLRETFAGWLGPVKTLLIVLDQFEEYFLYHPRDDGPGTFAGEFVDVVNDPLLRVNILLSLREDGLSKLDRFQGRIPALFDNYLRVDHLDLTAARAAITGPLDEYNRRLASGAPAARIDDDLVDAILDEVSTGEPLAGGARGPAAEARDVPAALVAPAADRVETPLLQLVMARLWEAGAPHLRLATLRDELGGTENIVYRHLAEALDELGEADRDLAVDVLRPLVSPARTKIAWRAEDLAYWAKRETADVEPILRELSSGQRRILRTVAPPPGQPDQALLYEIFHDVLAEPILAWCAEREAERERAELAREVERQEREREALERRRRRRRRRRMLRGAALVLVAVTLAVAYVAYHRSEVAASRGLAASATAQLGFDPERSLLLALRALDRRDGPEAEQALRLSLGTSRVRAVLGAGPPRPCLACHGLATPDAHAGGEVLRPLAIAPDGRTVAAVVGGRVRLWRPEAGVATRPGIDIGTAIGVAFTPGTGRLLVVGSRGAALMAPDGTRAVRLPGDFTGGATSPDGRYVVTAGRDGAAIWDVRDGRRLARITDTGYGLAAFAAGRRIVLQNDFGELAAWRWPGKRSRLLARAAAAGQGLLMQYAAGGGFAVDSATGGGVRVVDAAGTATRLPPGEPADPISAAYISDDGSRIATVRRTTVELWRSSRPWSAPAERVAKLVHPDGVSAVVFSADSKLVGTASSDGTARIWESSTGGLLTELRGHSAGVQWLAFSSSGRYVATVAEDLTVRLWDLGEQRVLRGAKGVDAIAVDRAGSRVAFVEGGGALKVWPARASKPVVLDPRPEIARGIAARDLHPTSVAMSADARSLLVGYETVDGGDGRAVLLNPVSGRVRAAIVGSGPVQAVALAPDSRLAAIVRASSGGSLVEVWGLPRFEDPRPPWRLPLLEGERPTDAAFSPDGRRLLVTGVFGAARIFDVTTRRQVRTLASGSPVRPGPEAFYRGVFSPDGKTVAVAGSRDVRLWDAASGAERGFSLTGHESALRSVAYSADGRRIVTSSTDGTVRVWDARDGSMLAVVRRHSGAVNGALFLPDGQIVSGGDDRTVRAYPCETCASLDVLRDRARRQVTRELTKRELEEFGG